MANKNEDKFFEGVGRRKTAVARVRVMKGKGMLVNEKDLGAYFGLGRLEKTAQEPLTALKLADTYRATVRVKGGGVKAQAEAIRHGLARAIAKAEPDFVARLRTSGWLTRDPRMVERKKYGLKKARRAPQWQKR